MREPSSKKAPTASTARPRGRGRRAVVRAPAAWRAGPPRSTRGEAARRRGRSQESGGVVVVVRRARSRAARRTPAARVATGSLSFGVRLIRRYKPRRSVFFRTCAEKSQRCCAAPASRKNVIERAFSSLPRRHGGRRVRPTPTPRRARGGRGRAHSLGGRPLASAAAPTLPSSPSADHVLRPAPIERPRRELRGGVDRSARSRAAQEARGRCAAKARSGAAAGSLRERARPVARGARDASAGVPRGVSSLAPSRMRRVNGAGPGVVPPPEGLRSRDRSARASARGGPRPAARDRGTGPRDRDGRILGASRDRCAG